METVYKLYNMYFTKCTQSEYEAIGAGNYSPNTQYIVKQPDGSIMLYLGDKCLVSGNNYTDEDKEKVSFLPDESTQNDFNKAFQSDWNETNQNSLAYIKNKPAFSDAGITINGPIQSKSQTIIFNASTYNPTDISRINNYINKGASAEDDTLKYDFYLDRVIQTDDKVILTKLVNHDWKSCNTTTNTSILGTGNYKFSNNTKINYIPTKIYTYDSSTNAWVDSDNDSNVSLSYFNHQHIFTKYEYINISYKYLYAWDYDSSDLSRIQEIIDGVGTPPTEDEYIKYDINMNGKIDASDKVLVENFIPDSVGVSNYWKEAYVTRSIRFGDQRYEIVANTHSHDSNIINTAAVLRYKKDGDTDYTRFQNFSDASKNILDVRNININNVIASEYLESPSGNITNLIATNETVDNLNATSVSIANSLKLDGQTITDIATTGTEIQNISSQNAIPTTVAIKDFMQNYPVSQVQANWLTSDSTSPSYILNKPTIVDPTDFSNLQSQVATNTSNISNNTIDISVNANNITTLDNTITETIRYEAYNDSNNPISVGKTLTFNSTKTHSVLLFGAINGCDFGVVCGIHYVKGTGGVIVGRRIQGVACTTDSSDDFYRVLIDIHIDTGTNNDGNDPSITALKYRVYKNESLQSGLTPTITVIKGVG